MTMSRNLLLKNVDIWLESEVSDEDEITTTSPDQEQHPCGQEYCCEAPHHGSAETELNQETIVNSLTVREWGEEISAKVESSNVVDIICSDAESVINDQLLDEAMLDIKWIPVVLKITNIFTSPGGILRDDVLWSLKNNRKTIQVSFYFPEKWNNFHDPQADYVHGCILHWWKLLVFQALACKEVKNEKKIIKTHHTPFFTLI